MLTRRDWLRITAGAGAALTLDPRLLLALQSGPVRTRAIPSSGEQVPVIGLGGRWISANSSAEELAGHRAVLHALAEGAEGAGRLFDSAAGYGGGGSEEYAGRWAEEDGFQDRIFWATKVNVAGRGGSSADPAEVRAQIERSFERMRLDVIDLNQVHNMGDPPTQLGMLQEYKGVRPDPLHRHDHHEREPVRRARAGDARLPHRLHRHRLRDRQSRGRGADLPARPGPGHRRAGYLPFGRTRMWQRIGDRPLPEWAAEFDAHTWAQFMLKFVVAHSGVTVACPGTGDPEHMVDNLGGGRGRLPTPEHVRRMTALVESLPGG
jgi:aryl-alcohol dehydrogenase-like predicted oxidoreductase